MKTVAMVGWSGSGRWEDLERTVIRKLAARPGSARRVGDALLVDSVDPVEVAGALSHLPGVAWVAVGYRFSGMRGYIKNIQLLGKRYLSKGRTFRISAQVVRSKQSAGDAVLAGNSELLSTVGGTKVDERRPQVMFRVCMEGAKGACGAEIREGPAGAPTGSDWVSCMVSGGERSSSMAWMAAVSGYSVRLVHSRTDEAALRQVARLYSELSFRMDARCLELVVLEGKGAPIGRLGAWLRGNEGTAFAGLRPARAGMVVGLAERFPRMSLPLVLFQDAALSAVYRSLGVGRAAAGAEGVDVSIRALEAGGEYTERRFGGVQADSNAVIDAIKRRS